MSISSTWNTTASCCEVAVYCMRLFELAVLATGLPSFVVFTYVLLTKKVFHANLRLLLFLIASTDMFICCSRIPEIFNFTGVPPFYGFFDNVKKTCWMVCALCTCALTMERILANLMCGSYGECCGGFPLFSLLAYIGQWCIAMLNYYLISNNLISTVLYFCSPFIALLIVLSIITRMQYNEVILRRFDQSYDANKMNQRYQANENMRCHDVLRIYIPFYSSIIFLNSVIIVVLYLWILTEAPRYFLVVQGILYMTCSPRILGCMFIVVYRHRTLQREVRRIFRLNSHQLTPLDIVNAKGVQLAYTSDMEREMYFDALRNQWK